MNKKSTKKKKSFFDSLKEFDEYESMPTLEDDEKNCDFEEYSYDNNLPYDFSPDPDENDPEEREFDNEPLAHSEYEDVKEFVWKTEKVYLSYKPEYKDYISSILLPILGELPLACLFSFVFALFGGVLIYYRPFGTIGIIAAVVLFIPVLLISYNVLKAIFFLLCAPKRYKFTRYILTDRRIMWIYGSSEKTCVKLTYKQISAVSTHTHFPKSRGLETVTVSTEIRPRKKHEIKIYGVPSSLNLGKNLINAIKAVKHKQKPKFTFSASAPKQENIEI